MNDYNLKNNILEEEEFISDDYFENGELEAYDFSYEEKSFFDLHEGRVIPNNNDSVDKTKANKLDSKFIDIRDLPANIDEAYELISRKFLVIH